MDPKDFPAFPCVETIEYGSGPVDQQHTGMTLRDYFAAKALAAIISLPRKDDIKRGAAGVPILAKYAYEYADAMLAERAA